MLRLLLPIALRNLGALAKLEQSRLKEEIRCKETLNEICVKGKEYGGFFLSEAILI